MPTVIDSALLLAFGSIELLYGMCDLHDLLKGFY